MNPSPSVTEDALLGGKVRFRQPRNGYRAGMDAALLAATCDARSGERVVDVGCGAGAVMLAAAFRRPDVNFVGLERDLPLVELARINIALNGREGRMSVIMADVAKRFSTLGLAPFDAAMCNPPFFDDLGDIRDPSPAKQPAWVADAGLAGWIGFLIKAVREGGVITLIHRADRLADILALLSPKAGSFQIRPVHPSAAKPAKRVLVRAIKTGKAPLQILPGIHLHDQDGVKHSAAAEAIFRGEPLGWNSPSAPPNPSSHLTEGGAGRTLLASGGS